MKKEDPNEIAAKQTPFEAFEELTRKLLRVKKSEVDLHSPIRPRKKPPVAETSDESLSETAAE